MIEEFGPECQRYLEWHGIFFFFYFDWRNDMDLKGARGFGGTPGWWTNRYDQSKYHVINSPKIKLIK